MPPKYPAPPIPLVLGIGWSALTRQRRNFRQDALHCATKWSIEILGTEYAPKSGPGVIVFNHYSRAGFSAWWMALAISAVLPFDIHWVMTAAWTDSGTLLSQLKEIVSVRIFPLLARVYGFTTMPPMPPRPQDLHVRAQSARNVLAVTRRSPPPVLAFAPEGQDSADGSVMRLHPGVGRFLFHLDKTGCQFFPVGVYETTTSLCLNFGKPVDLSIPAGLSPDQIDELAADRVMRAIAALLPEMLRGYYR